MTSLEPLRACFEGAAMSFVTTQGVNGKPYARAVSRIDFVDDRHVALMLHSMNADVRKYERGAKACLLVTDPRHHQLFKLWVRFVRSETDGPVYQAMALRAAAVASLIGARELMQVLAAQIYEVERIEQVDMFRGQAAG